MLLIKFLIRFLSAITFAMLAALSAFFIPDPMDPMRVALMVICGLLAIAMIAIPWKGKCKMDIDDFLPALSPVLIGGIAILLFPSPINVKIALPFALFGIVTIVVLLSAE